MTPPYRMWDSVNWNCCIQLDFPEGTECHGPMQWEGGKSWAYLFYPSKYRNGHKLCEIQKKYRKQSTQDHQSLLYFCRWKMPLDQWQQLIFNFFFNQQTATNFLCLLPLFFHLPPPLQPEYMTLSKKKNRKRNIPVVLFVRNSCSRSFYSQVFNNWAGFQVLGLVTILLFASECMFGLQTKG